MKRFVFAVEIEKCTLAKVHTCFSKKVFRKYMASLQESTTVEVQFQESCFPEPLFEKPLWGAASDVFIRKLLIFCNLLDVTLVNYSA